MSLFENKGITNGEIINLSPSEAMECCKNGAYLVDIRKEYETDYKTFEVENLILLPKNKLPENYKTIPQDKPVIIADSTGLSSKKAIMFLKEKGYENLANLAGGIMQWTRDNLPLKIDNNEALAKPYFYESKPKNFVKSRLVKKDFSEK
ncbi:MAG: rhodanese-like domain-containing protein [Rhodothermaceae bacterium]